MRRQAQEVAVVPQKAEPVRGNGVEFPPCCTLEEMQAAVRDSLPECAEWVATGAKIHFVNGVEFPPWCMQRKGKSARPLKRIFARDVGVESALNLGLSPCMECVDTYLASLA